MTQHSLSSSFVVSDDGPSENDADGQSAEVIVVQRPGRCYWMTSSCHPTMDVGWHRRRPHWRHNNGPAVGRWRCRRPGHRCRHLPTAKANDLVQWRRTMMTTDDLHCNRLLRPHCRALIVAVCRGCIIFRNISIPKVHLIPQVFSAETIPQITRLRNSALRILHNATSDFPAPIAGNAASHGRCSGDGGSLSD